MMYRKITKGSQTDRFGKLAVSWIYTFKRGSIDSVEKGLRSGETNA